VKRVDLEMVARQDSSMIDRVFALDINDREDAL
jgi:hypothetical protein